MTDVYRCYDINDRLLYVGITGRGMRRHYEHARQAQWWDDVTFILIDHEQTVSDALRREAEHIAAGNPAHNTHRPAVTWRYRLLIIYRDGTIEDQEWARWLDYDNRRTRALLAPDERDQVAAIYAEEYVGTLLRKQSLTIAEDAAIWHRGIIESISGLPAEEMVVLHV